MKIIADIGSNWTRIGDLLLAADMAKCCDCDAFKIQYFSDADLYAPGAVRRNDRLKNTIDLDLLWRHCNRLGIEFMASVFNPDDIEDLNPYVERYKVASGEAKHYRLLEEIAKTAKPVIVSTGCYDDFNYLAEIFEPDLVTLLYCVAEYPARLTDIRVLSDLINNSPFKVGFSDHSYDLVATAEIAREYGCTVFERHFNPSYMTSLESPDSGPHALNPSDMAYYCRYLKQKGSIFQPDKNTYFRRRPIATEKIRCGEKLVYGQNWDFLRPQKKEHDGDINWEFHNKELFAQREIAFGESLSWSNCGICTAQSETECSTTI
jgi:sialic acid synthase SpsE